MPPSPNSPEPSSPSPGFSPGLPGNSSNHLKMSFECSGIVLEFGRRLANWATFPAKGPSDGAKGATAGGGRAKVLLRAPSEPKVPKETSYKALKVLIRPSR